MPLSQWPDENANGGSDANISALMVLLMYNESETITVLFSGTVLPTCTMVHCKQGNTIETSDEYIKIKEQKWKKLTTDVGKLLYLTYHLCLRYECKEQGCKTGSAFLPYSTRDKRTGATEQQCWRNRPEGNAICYDPLQEVHQKRINKKNQASFTLKEDKSMNWTTGNWGQTLSPSLAQRNNWTLAETKPRKLH